MSNSHPFSELVTQFGRIYCLNDAILIPSKPVSEFHFDTLRPCDSRQRFEKRFARKHNLELSAMDIIKDRYLYDKQATQTNENSIHSPFTQRNTLYEITSYGFYAYPLLAQKRIDMTKREEVCNTYTLPDLHTITDLSYQHGEKNIEFKTQLFGETQVRTQLPAFACKIEQTYYTFDAVTLQLDFRDLGSDLIINGPPRTAHHYNHFFVWDSNEICYGSDERWQRKNIEFFRMYPKQVGAHKIVETLKEAEYVLHYGYANKELTPVKERNSSDIPKSSIYPLFHRVYENRIQ
ncbi:MAG: hypothetical protein ACMXYA_01310 [Candidatus Woesearchaeota archaeon]